MFEKQRQQFLYKRRGFLFDKNYKMYKHTVDRMIQAEENCLQNVLDDLLELTKSDDEQWQSSLHYHCSKESKRIKIAKISNFGKNFANVQLVFQEKEKKLHDL